MQKGFWGWIKEMKMQHPTPQTKKRDFKKNQDWKCKSLSKIKRHMQQRKRKR